MKTITENKWPNASEETTKPSPAGSGRGRSDACSVSMLVTCVQLVSAACGMSCRAVKHYTQQPTTNFAFSRQDLVISLNISDITLVYAETVLA